MEQEIWKIIEDYPMYEVSNLGKVRKISSGKVLKQCLDSKGYPSVNINIGKRTVLKVVHRFVATAFIDNPDNKEEVDHINTIRTDDRVENLRWVTHKENMNNSKTTRNKIVGASIAFKSKKIYVYDTSKSKRGKCVLSFLSPKTAAKFFGVHYRVIMKALDNENERVCGYLIRSERKKYKTKSK